MSRIHSTTLIRLRNIIMLLCNNVSWKFEKFYFRNKVEPFWSYPSIKIMYFCKVPEVSRRFLCGTVQTLSENTKNYSFKNFLWKKCMVETHQGQQLFLPIQLKHQHFFVNDSPIWIWFKIKRPNKSQIREDEIIQYFFEDKSFFKRKEMLHTQYK